MTGAAPLRGFATTHELWSAPQQDAAQIMAARIAQENIQVVRFAFCDAHGVLRGKTLMAAEALRVLADGVTATTTLLLKDLSGRTAFPVFTAGGGFGIPAMQGAADMLMLPDPTTFHILPWAPHTGWVLCDLYFTDGSAMPLSTRAVLQNCLARLAAQELEFVAGLEVECHLFRLTDALPDADPAAGPAPPAAPPRVARLNAGYQYLTEFRYDELDDLLEILRRHLQALRLDLRSIEIEFGPSQVEFTFGPANGLEAADRMLLFRSAVKQICRRQGIHASFMCRPKLPDIVSSGWHLHQSLRRADGSNALAGPKDGAHPLSAFGQAYLAGLLEHASAAAAFSTPTINGYKRYRSFSNAPDRASWARDNRGVMLRVLGGNGSAATRIENRVGEPAANPYLYMGAQIICGLDGVARGLAPGASADAPYDHPAPLLPRSLMDSIAALRQNAALADGFGGGFIDYFIRLKEAEIGRFLADVTDWEHREYFAVL